MIAPSRLSPISRTGSIGDGAATNRSPRLPGDAQYHSSDCQSDEGICKRETECDYPGRSNDPEAHVGVGASVIPVSNERPTADALTSSSADPSGQVVAAESNGSGNRHDREIARLRRLNQAPNGLDTDNRRR
jgi:hypothetical protein